MNRIFVVLVAGVVATGVLAGQLWGELRDVRVQSSQLRERMATLQTAQIAAARAPVQSVQEGSDPAVTAPEAQAMNQAMSVQGIIAAASSREAASPEAAAGKATSGATGNAKEGNVGAAVMEGLAKIMNTQAGRDMVMAQARMMLPRMYPDLATELGLSPAQEEQFFEMLTRQQMDSSTEALGMLNGASMDRAAAQEMQRKISDMQRANQAEIAGLLGDKTPAWQEYQKTLPVRRQVNQLQDALGPSNALSETQKKAVISTMAAEQARINEERRRTPPTPAGTVQNTVDVQIQREMQTNQRMVDAASVHMNAEQSEAFRRLLEQQQEMARTLMRSIQP